MASAGMGEAAGSLEGSEVLDPVPRRAEARGEGYQTTVVAGSDQPVSVQAFQF